MSNASGDEVERKASALLEMGRPAEAAVLLRQILAHDAGHWRAAALLSTAELRQGHKDSAVAAAQQAVRLAPQQEWGYRVLAIASTSAKRGEEAKGAATMAVKLAPRSYQGYVVLVGALLEVRDRAGARRAAEQAIALNPQSAAPFIQMSAAAFAAEDWELMELASRNALARDPESVAALNNLGCSLLRQHRAAEAVPLYESAARLDPSFLPVRKTLYRLNSKLRTRSLLSDETRQLMEAERRARRFSLQRRDWSRLLRFRPWWWRGFEKIPPPAALPVHIAALGACVLGIVDASGNTSPAAFIALAAWLSLMLPRSFQRAHIWWTVRHPGTESWANQGVLATEPGDPDY